jgi:antitoxin component YwqK of YwqJK toxin-antitoxin module
MLAAYVLDEKEAIYEHGCHLWKQTIYHQDGKEERKFWYRNKSILSHEFSINGFREGECKWWWDNGQLMEKAFYRNGKLDGEWKFWRSNGQLMDKAFYQNGKLEGKRKYWHENGRIWQQSFFRNGIQDGEILYWLNDGTVKSHEFYGFFVQDHISSILYRFSNKKKHIILMLKGLLYPDILSELDNFLIPDLR